MVIHTTNAADGSSRKEGEYVPHGTTQREHLQDSTGRQTSINYFYPDPTHWHLHPTVTKSSEQAHASCFQSKPRIFANAQGNSSAHAVDAVRLMDFLSKVA
eukprot:1146173-Pelagomonas_calceolata.AAC.3